MIDFNKRSSEKELLDQKEIPFGDIFLNMKELEFINSRLGGHSITIHGFKNLLQNKKTISVCEIGCGGGDNLNALNKYCLKNHVICAFTGIDINKDCIAFAEKKSSRSNVHFFVSDYRDFDFKNEKPDIIFSSLFCHHFSNNELVKMLHWMKNNSKVGFFINDLHRHPVAYHFIKYATKIFSKSYLVKNDAPISVLRAFKKQEWENIFKQAKMENYSIEWKWAFRFLITSFNNN